MKRFVRITAVVVVVLVVVIAALIFAFLRGWHITKQTPEEISSLLTPFFQIKKPESKGPFPTIVAFFGAGPIPAKNVDAWTDYLVGLGYATIVVDSFTPRGLITWDDIKKTVRRGQLLGSERAGDVLVALDEVRKMPFVDMQRLAIAGWSHGAWSIMDLLAMDPPKELPTNLQGSADQPLKGVKAAILFYPYCGFPAKSRGRGWPQDIQVLMLMGGKDTVVPTEECLEIVSILKNGGRPVKAHVYPFAQHAFDFLEEDFKELPDIYHPDPESTSDARERIKQLLAEVFNSPQTPRRRMIAAPDGSNSFVNSRESPEQNLNE